MFERLHTQAAKAYSKKPQPGVGSTPFFTRLSATEQTVSRVRTEEPSASGAQPNLPSDAGKIKRNVSHSSHFLWRNKIFTYLLFHFCWIRIRNNIFGSGSRQNFRIHAVPDPCGSAILLKTILYPWYHTNRGRT